MSMTSGDSSNRVKRGPPPPASRFVRIFAQLNLHAAEVEGDSFHRYTAGNGYMAIRKAR